MPAAPVVPSERSASNANAIEPSSKPGNDDGVFAGATESRLGGGGGGSQLGFDMGAGVTDPRVTGAAPRGPDGASEGGGGGDERALASAAAPVPFEGGAFDGDGGGADGSDEVGGPELANALVARCAPLLARAGNGGGLPAGDPSVFTLAFAVAISSGVGGVMRVESIRTAAIVVESFDNE